MLLASAIFFCGMSYGQLVTIGPKVGISSSTVDFDELTVNGQTIESGDAKVGFHAGLFARITLLGFYIQPEALFTQSGGEIQLSENSVDDVLDYTYNKLDVPVMAGIKIGDFFRLNAGPVFSLLLSDDLSIDGLGTTVDEVNDNYNNATVGYQAGAGIDISKLTFDLRYEGSLSKLTDNFTVRGSSFNTDLRNNQWVFSVGLKLN